MSDQPLVRTEELPPFGWLWTSADGRRQVVEEMTFGFDGRSRWVEVSGTLADRLRRGDAEAQARYDGQKGTRTLAWGRDLLRSDDGTTRIRDRVGS